MIPHASLSWHSFLRDYSDCLLFPRAPCFPKALLRGTPLFGARFHSFQTVQFFPFCFFLNLFPSSILSFFFFFGPSPLFGYHDETAVTSGRSSRVGLFLACIVFVSSTRFVLCLTNCTVQDLHSSNINPVVYIRTNFGSRFCLWWPDEFGT
jgi:hypothetical protein